MVGPLISGAILAFSLAALVKASIVAIESVEELVEITGLSDSAAGFVVLAIATSMPEMGVAVFAVLQGTPGISVGDLLGSNMFNIGVTVGVIAVMGALESVHSKFLVEIVDLLFLSSIIPVLLVAQPLAQFQVGPLTGGILLGIFALSVYFAVREGKHALELEKAVRAPHPGKGKVVAKAVAGIAAVVVAARAATWAAAEIAAALGVSPMLIGAKIVAIGTSLPELVLDVTAVRRGRVQLAVADAIGSNLANITLILGVLLLISPLEVDLTVFGEILPFLLLLTLLLWRFLVKGGVPRWGGIAMLLIYVAFQAVLVPH